MTKQLPRLPYEYNGLEPQYSEYMLKIHHGKHHQAYTDKFNAALEAAGLEGKSTEEVLKSIDSLESPQKTAIFNHGGGYYNHAFFWQCLRPNPENTANIPSQKMMGAIQSTFGSFETFKEQFSATAVGHFGSGWAWLVKNAEGTLKIIDLHDQDTPLRHGYTPLLTLDVWEHAYYLQYENRRAEFIEKFFSIINWDFVEQQLLLSEQN